MGDGISKLTPTSLPTTGHRFRTWSPSPEERMVRSGASCLQEGHSGDLVRRLQQMLNETGAKPALTIDGKLGPRTRQAVLQFQRERGLCADGLVGRQTWRALQQRVGEVVTAPDDRGTVVTQSGSNPKTTVQLESPQELGCSLRPNDTPTVRPPVDLGAFLMSPGRTRGPFGLDRTTRELQGEALLRANGQWPPEDGHVYVIQIDQDAPPAPDEIPLVLMGPARREAEKRREDQQRRVDQYLQRYTGQLVVFKAVNGRLVEQNPEGPLRSATHPGQRKTSSAPDVNGDRVSDIAHLRSGVYEYRGSVNGSNRFNPVSDPTMTVARDLDHNGVIDEHESEAEFIAQGIQIHAGNSGGPSSIGCQTVQPDDFRVLVKTLQKIKPKTFTYLCVRRPNDETGANPF